MDISDERPVGNADPQDGNFTAGHVLAKFRKLAIILHMIFPRLSKLLASLLYHFSFCFVILR